MKKLILLAAFVAFCAQAHAACEDKFAFGEPQPKGDYTHLCRLGYADIHDNKHKIPLVVFEHLDPKTMAHVKRKDAFREDPDIRPDARARLGDYKTGSKTYDRGHMADAQDSINDEAMFETFLLSNMVPQVNTFNEGMWRFLETHVADMARHGRELYVITGPIADGSKTIGNGVAVPSKLYKIVIDKKANESIAYIIPNEASKKSYTEFQVTLEDVEKVTGIDYLPNAGLLDKAKLLKSPGTTLK